MLRALNRPTWLLVLPLLGGWAACGRDGRETPLTAAAGSGDQLAMGGSSAGTEAGDAAGMPAGDAGDGGAPTNACADGAPINAWASWPLTDSGVGGEAAFTLTEETATDAVTGLVWQRHLADQPLSWSEAKQYCDCLSLAGHDDWGLPSRLELVSIVDATRQNPSIDAAAFPDTPLEWFWTASAVAEQSDQYWYVAFFDGDTHAASTEQQYWARCVRHQDGALPRYSVTPTTVTDRSTGLTWQRDVSATRVTWPEADAACTALELDGAGWRLPSMHELQSLIDESRAAPAIDPEAFPTTPSEGFWAGTALAGVPGSAWFVSFDEGIAYNAVHEHPYRFRCVR
jgi:hypothetical protein